MNGFYWIYIIMFGFLLAYEITKDQNTKRLIYWGAFGFLLLMYVAQDKSVNRDLTEYMIQWDIIPNLSFVEMLQHKFEIGYVLLCRVLESTFLSPRVLLLVLGVITLFPFCWYYEKQTEDPMVALMAFLALGLYTHSLGIIRQLAAMAILTFAIPFIQKRRLVPFLLVVVAATAFHKVAFLFLPVYFLYGIPIKKWLFPVSAGISLCLCLFGPSLIQLCIRLFYPGYQTFPLVSNGGSTLLAMLWMVVCLSYWLLKDHLEQPNVKLSFLTVLLAAVIQPVCFVTYLWHRVVFVYFAMLVPLTCQLYQSLFRDPDNRLMAWLSVGSPKLHKKIRPWYGKTWFTVLSLTVLFGVLFVWFASDLEDVVYRMAPI